MFIIACSALMAVLIWGGCAAPKQETNNEASPGLSSTLDVQNPTEAEAEFLRQLKIVDERVRSHEQLLLETLSDARLERSQLFKVLAAAIPAGDLRRMYQIVEQTKPVPTLQSDRKRYASYVRDVADRSRGYEQAVDAEDLLAVHRFAVDIMVARALMLSDVSPTFCLAALAEPVCESATRLGDDYGIKVQGIFRELAARIGPRISFLPPQYERAEAEEIAEAFQSAIVDALQRALEPVRRLQPPAELVSDHERFVQYLSESLELFTLSDLQQPIAERFREQLEEFAALTVATRDDLTPTARTIVLFFEE